jgi:hypothetical protein
MEIVVQQPFISMKTKILLMIMQIVGNVSNQEEANEINFIAQLFVVGQRARLLAKESNKKS